MPQSYSALYSHVVFSTKNRKPDIVLEIRDRLYSILGGICRKHDCILMKAGGIPDHVHLLISMSRECAIATLVRDLKSNSTGWVKATYLDRPHFSWQEGYAAFSVSHSQLNIAKRYIETQEAHHKKFTFKEEVVAFLDRHEVKYDKRYLWV